MSLTTGLSLLKQQHYHEAVPLLKAIAQPGSSASPKERVRAQMALVQAYGALGETEAAIAICRELSRVSHPRVQQWAKQQWRSLQAPTPLASKPNFEAVLPQAHDAIARQDWTTAIDLLEETLNPQTPTPKDPAPYQLLLIEAHLGQGNNSAALALCEALKTNPDPVVQAWVKQTRKRLQPSPRKPKVSVKRSPPSPQVSGLWWWVALGLGGAMAWGFWSQLGISQQLAQLLPAPPPGPNEVVKTPIIGGLNSKQAFPAPYTVMIPETMVNHAVQQMNRINPPKEVRLHESEQFYDIEGRTAYQLWNAIGDKAQYIPSGSGQGTHAIASAALKPRWNFTTRRTSSHCWISDVKIDMDVLYTYPRWVDATAGTGKLRNAWEQYRQFLIRHEKGHTQIAIDALSDVENQILALGTRRDCPTVIEAAKELAIQRWQASSQTQTNYDANENDPDQYILRRLAVQERYQVREGWSRGF